MIPFKQIPAGQRAPLFYAELDASKANTAAQPQRALLIGQKTAVGSYAPSIPVVAQSTSDARAAAGQGSVLAGMVTAYRASDPDGEMWVLPLADDPAAVAATGSITFTGATTLAQTLSLYIAGRLFSVALAAGQSPAQVAATVAAAIAAVPEATVIAVAAAGAINLTAKNAGLVGNDIDIRVNYLGAPGGQATPAGLGVVIVAMAGGAANPSLTAALTNMQDTSFDFIACSLTDAPSMAAVTALLSDTAPGRWSYATQIYGHCFIAYRGTAGAAAAYATGLNNQHVSCIGYTDSPTPPWRWAAALAGAAASSIRIDPGVPLQYLTLAGVLAPPVASRFSSPIRNNTLLYGGVTTWTADTNNVVTLENVVTTYVTNAAGQTDDSYLEVETLFLLMAILRRLRGVVTTKFARVKLAADGTRAMPGARVVTPAIIRAELIAQYRQLEAEGMVQGSAAFAAALVVEKSATNPNRVDVLLPAVLIDQLRVLAMLVQFRLQ
ncbi:phage tail sheath subtilisin-like domain-containing protein [Sphingomonas bacterium]|uniref:phage tail sheath subtilisin-like domain-containing protein n=1 Tax=Sphingomonas bacterium TaxID=1895847 RepID=UPI001C2DA0E0|nr:phage tail sheath subtilisin-like domain-containing protein [Sphingomonas bacterium]